MADDPLAAHLAAHYDLGFERDRLFRAGEPRLELTRTLELLDRFLPSAPARLIDGGAAPAPTPRSGHDRATTSICMTCWSVTSKRRSRRPMPSPGIVSPRRSLMPRSIPEPPGWLMQEDWSDPDRREQMLLAARAVESEPTLSGLSSHLLTVGTKPGAVQPG